MKILLDWMDEMFHDPKGFLLAMAAFAAVAFVNALSRGETILRSLAHGLVTFILCGSIGAILIFYCNIHPFVACGICGLVSTIAHRILPALERLVGVAEKKVASVIEHFDVPGVEEPEEKKEEKPVEPEPEIEPEKQEAEPIS